MLNISYIARLVRFKHLKALYFRIFRNKKNKCAMKLLELIKKRLPTTRNIKEQQNYSAQKAQTKTSGSKGLSRDEDPFMFI